MALTARVSAGVKDFVTASDIPAGGVNCWSGDLAGVPGRRGAPSSHVTLSHMCRHENKR